MVIKMYLPDDLQIQVHQSRIQMYPESFSPGFYWYGKRKHGPGHASIKKIQKTETNYCCTRPAFN